MTINEQLALLMLKNGASHDEAAKALGLSEEDVRRIWDERKTTNAQNPVNAAN